MHSPFVFDFMKHVLYDHRHFYAYDEIEKMRENLLKGDLTLEVTDYGTGTSSKRSLKSIIKTSVKPAKQAQLLFRIVDHYKCYKILELGTSLGLTALYLASASKNSNVITLEGDPQIALQAQKNFNALKKKNILLCTGKFEETLNSALTLQDKTDLIFFDGNHREEATLQYFQQSLHHADERSIFIFDDIHWSRGMKKAWHIVQVNERVTITIDLFYLGIVFFRKELSKQHFVLRF